MSPIGQSWVNRDVVGGLVAGVVDDVLGWDPAGLSVDGDAPPAFSGYVGSSYAGSVGESLQDGAFTGGFGSEDGGFLSPIGQSWVNRDRIVWDCTCIANTCGNIPTYCRQLGIQVPSWTHCCVRIFVAENRLDGYAGTFSVF